MPLETEPRRRKRLCQPILKIPLHCKGHHHPNSIHPIDCPMICIKTPGCSTRTWCKLQNCSQRGNPIRDKKGQRTWEGTRQSNMTTPCNGLDGWVSVVWCHYGIHRLASPRELQDPPRQSSSSENHCSHHT